MRTESPPAQARLSYLALLHVRGFPRLVASQFLGRIAGAMLRVSLVLFVLSRYHSPQLAGAATFLLLFPGLLVAPIAGALLDRHDRTRLISLDYMVAAGALFSVAVLSSRHELTPAVLLGICAVASLTGPLSWAGLRSMFPTVVPDHLWERANALDSSSDVLATVVGAPLGGIIVAFAGGEWALAVCAALFACAGLAVLRVPDPSIKLRARRISAEAWSGVLYVVRNRSLVGLALTFFGFTVGWGCIVIAMPVLVLGRLHQGPAVVGLLWGAVGAAAFVSTLVVGRLRTAGRERQLMSLSMAAMAAAMAFLPGASSILIVAAAMTAVGLVETPFDIAFLTLRQRRTDPARFGSVFAISMALNQLGAPIGSALAGPLIAVSLNAALWFAVAFMFAGAVVPMLVIPRHAGNSA